MCGVLLSVLEVTVRSRTRSFRAAVYGCPPQRIPLGTVARLWARALKLPPR